MKKIVSLLLAIMLLLGALSTGAEGFAGMPNPMVEYADLGEIQDEYPGLEMEEPPEGAADVLYFVIDLQNGYAIADVQFTLDGVAYDYRAVQLSEGDTYFNKDNGYLAGLYYDFDVETSETVENAGMDVHYCTGEQTGFVAWYDAEADCSYSLSAKTSLKALKETASKLVRSNVSYSVAEGVALSYENEVLRFRLANGNIVPIPLETEEEIVPGDGLELTYAGDLLNSPYVIRIDVTEPAGQFFGTVTKHDKNSVTVQAPNGNHITFTLTEYSIVTGADTEIKNHAQVTLTYSGSLAGSVSAFEVYIDVPGEEMDPSLIDKTLTGTVTKLTNSSLSIKTSNGKKYSFRRTANTEMSGKGTLKVNCTVTVRYDGYASNTPEAKEITVTRSAPKPTATPKPTSKDKKVTGVITAVCGIWISLDDGHVYTVNSANCKIKNSQYCQVGNIAEFTFRKSGSDRICSKATFKEMLDY